MISLEHDVTVSVAPDDSPAFSEGPSHLEAQPCISWMRRTVEPVLSLISMVMFCQGGVDGPVVQVS
ncbi:hypothetical protein GCM10019017_11930 [Streptomyces showdoensis]